MTKTRFSSGSEWRKWDLHLHVPGTKLSDGYPKTNGKPDWEKFADSLEESDVAVFGLTDYFSASNTLDFIDFFRERYPDSRKLLLVNVEVRLNESVNRGAEQVDLHVLFSEATPRTKIDEYLSKLKTVQTDQDGRQRVCTDLSSTRDFEAATVTRSDLDRAYQDVFGASLRTEHLMYLAPANNSGIRAKPGDLRKAHLADEIDKLVDAIYGGAKGNREHFLQDDRYEDASQASGPKPVFGGCDAHSFEQLHRRLGKALQEEGDHQVVTWVKADPTWEGLTQTLIEPDERVRLDPGTPDSKSSYQVISRVRFSGSNDFPAEIDLNPNLASIIGSRSSGKSALLAFIAHAVDPAATIAIQQELADRTPGPAAGKTWDEVSDTTCEVQWASGETTGGQVVYIPQNSLHRLSEQPEEITRRISPALFRKYPELDSSHAFTTQRVSDSTSTVETAVRQWFRLADKIANESKAIEQIGEQATIRAEMAGLDERISGLREATELTDEQLTEYQAARQKLADLDQKSLGLREELQSLAPYAVQNEEDVQLIEGSVQVTITTRPSQADVPQGLRPIVREIVDSARQSVAEDIETAVHTFVADLFSETVRATAERNQLEESNQELFERYKQYALIDEALQSREDLNNRLVQIAGHEELIAHHIEAQQQAVAQISSSLAAVESALKDLHSAFDAEPRILDDITFRFESEVAVSDIEAASDVFDKNRTTDYISKANPSVNFEKARTDPHAFLQAIDSEVLKLNRGYDREGAATKVLCMFPQIRYAATLDGDRIGGFSLASMTPGKQALFALTLLLHELAEPWPLLIDQPEDDLDSRSIYDTIVPYLKKRKRERQIIMVSHNANLVIGADSEQVIVANRHGDDRPNLDGQTFDYLTGSMECSKDLDPTAPTTLGACGIREHACSILDGGEEAFEKRKNSYKI